MIADAASNGVGKTASERFLANRSERRFISVLHRREKSSALFGGPAFGFQRGIDRAPHVGPAIAHEGGAREFTGQGVAEHDTDAIALQALRVGEAGIIKCARGHIESKPVSQI